MLTAIASLAIIGFLLGGGLSLAALLLRVETNPLADQIEAMLPGTQCGQCGYPGCRGFAEALSEGAAEITLCVPGGAALVEALAEKLQLTVEITVTAQRPELAFIHEEGCIGCTKCLQICPTDAIIGAPKQMHTVIQSVCAGGGKCVEVCPTECIVMQPAPKEPITTRNWHWSKPVPEWSRAA
ncbi:MAG: RnfABCDGE type electron transport complex subunit B [Pseudomonadota bacterium]|nr:RnfABCDGE type electron transport complex subunit B [Pseudomonadota bacterium]